MQIVVGIALVLGMLGAMWIRSRPLRNGTFSELWGGEGENKSLNSSSDWDTASPDTTKRGDDL